ncbi:hypothetical protein FACS189459_5100 [Bacilli bacterium]|nr:hypothetical protein FACS189459_5100 [Bacilli bacterium]
MPTTAPNKKENFIYKRYFLCQYLICTALLGILLIVVVVLLIMSNEYNKIYSFLIITPFVYITILVEQKYSQLKKIENNKLFIIMKYLFKSFIIFIPIIVCIIINVICKNNIFD